MGGDLLIIAVLLLAALVLMLLEVLTPSFGILAVGAIGAMVTAVVMAFQINVLFGFVMVVAVLVGAPAYLVWLVKVLPNTSLGRRLFLRKAPGATGAGTPEAETLKGLVGRTGRAETALRPSGAVRIGGRRFDGVAESGMIDKDETIKVIRAAGTDVIVRRVEPRN